MDRIASRLARIADYLAARRVAPESVALGALLVSITAGIVLAVGGALREPRLWLLVPSLALVRLALFAVEARLVDSRPSTRRQEEHFDGQR